MSILSSSQNQSSSQYSHQDQQPGLKNIINALDQQLDPQMVSGISKKLAKQIKNAKNQLFDQCMAIIVKLIGKGYGKELVKYSVILQVMMDKFSKLCHQIDNDPKAEMKLMYLLSAIAQLIKQASHVQISLKKGFLQSLLLIDQDLLKISPVKKDILAVLGVLYECSSRNAKALKKFQLLNQFKRAILANYSLIDQHFSSRLFNKALYNLAIQGESINQAQLAKYGVFKTLIRLMGEQQAGLLISKLKSALNKINVKKVNISQENRTQMVAESA